MKSHSKTLERRHHKRFAVTGNPLAVMRPAPSRPGKLLRISKDAAEIIYCQTDSITGTMTAEIDILVPDFTRGIFLDGIPMKTISDMPVAKSAAIEDEYDCMRKRVVKFEKLTSEQLGQLQSLIYSYAK
jgi:hypothetical protein